MTLKVVRWTFIVWTGVFTFLIVPTISLYEWSVAKRPVVWATVSNVHSVWHVKGRSGGAYWDYATLDFDRPDRFGPVHCHLENFQLGPTDRSDRTWPIQLAVHPYSCGEPARLPLRAPTTLWNWLCIYIGGALSSFLYVLLVTSGIRRKGRHRRPLGQNQLAGRETPRKDEL